MNRFYSYNNTYLHNNNFFNTNLKSPDNSFNIVSTIEDCERQAFNTGSQLFALSEFNRENNQATCLISRGNPTIAQSKENLNSLTPCITTNPRENCFFTNANGDNFGLERNLSVYTGPSLTINLLQDNDHTFRDRQDIENRIVGIGKLIRDYENKRRSYLIFYFNNIEVPDNICLSDDTNSKRINESDFFPYNKEEFNRLYNNMLQSRRRLEINLNNINTSFNTFLVTTRNLNETFRPLTELVEILNMKIALAEKFFNILMNKNQGAIGELDISQYNRSLAIFENIIITITMASAIYLYFKKE